MGDTGTVSSDVDVVLASWDEPLAFSVLFDRYARVVRRLVAGRAASDDVDDLVSETFVAAFRARGNYDHRYEDARPWLLGIAANILRHHSVPRPAAVGCGGHRLSFLSTLPKAWLMESMPRWVGTDGRGGHETSGTVL
jgi:hypothetical protein